MSVHLSVCFLGHQDFRPTRPPQVSLKLYLLCFYCSLKQTLSCCRQPQTGPWPVLPGSLDLDQHLIKHQRVSLSSLCCICFCWLKKDDQFQVFDFSALCLTVTVVTMWVFTGNTGIHISHMIPQGQIMMLFSTPAFRIDWNIFTTLSTDIESIRKK